MSISEQIKKIEAAAQELNTLALQINPLIKDLDAAMQRVNVGVEVWLEPPLEKLPNAHIQLGYGRTDQTNCSLAVRSVDIDSGETKWTRPLSHCSRETRLAAVGRLPQLFTEILKKLDSELANVDQARVEVPHIAEIFRQQPKKRRN
jgi:hypothetical protein